MRLIALTICGSIALLVLLAMLATIARHRAQHHSRERRSAALAEYLWAIIPWLMILSCAIPAARQIVASAREPLHAGSGVLSKATEVIDEQQREE